MLKLAFMVALAISANCLPISEATGLQDQSGVAKSHSDERRNGREGPQEATSVSKPEDLVAPSEPSAYVRVDEYLTSKTESQELKVNIRVAGRLRDRNREKYPEIHEIAKHLCWLAEDRICDLENLKNAVEGLRYITNINKDMFGDVYKERRLSRLWSDYVNKLRTKCEPEFESKWNNLLRFERLKALYSRRSSAFSNDGKFESLDLLNGQLYADQYTGARRDLKVISGAWQDFEQYLEEPSSTQLEDILNLLMINGDSDSDKEFDSNQPLLSLEPQRLLEIKLIKPCGLLFRNSDARQILTKATLLGYLLFKIQSHGLKSPQLQKSDFTGGEGPKIYKWAARYMTCDRLLSEMIEDASYKELIPSEISSFLDDE